MEESASTYYLPDCRKSGAELAREEQQIAGYLILAPLVDLPQFLLVTNECRQIVWANREATKMLGESDVRNLFGKRPGEALGCVHSSESPAGCGTTEFCVFCGAARSFAESLEGSGGAEECEIRRGPSHNFDSLDLLVWTKPFDLDDNRFILFNAQDISAQKHREALEHVFFHDILNTATTLKSLTSLIDGSACADRTFLDLADETVDRLVEEIASQRSLKAAEEGDLNVSASPVPADDILDAALRPFRHFFQEKGVRLDRAAAAEACTVITDPVLARRVVANMVKNALEATAKGGAVEAGCRCERNTVDIWVHNAAVLSEEARRRIFQRSFSTKGPGRGIGAYGMKLIAERYLGGGVDFDSLEGEGTEFRLRLPRNTDG